MSVLRRKGGKCNWQRITQSTLLFSLFSPSRAEREAPAEHAGLRTVAVSDKSCRVEVRLVKEEKLGLLSSVEILNESGPNSPPVIFSKGQLPNIDMEKGNSLV